MKKFKVYDMYDVPVCIGYADTYQEVRKIAKQQYDDTDGECMICYEKLNPVSQKYDRKTRRFILL